MKIHLYRSATVGIISDDFKLLQDPWLTDGEYYGSWSQYPKFDVKKNIDELNSYNAIYISHIHPDHCSAETLKLIDKKIPIYIHSYHAKFLKFKLQALGFKVIELLNNKDNFLNDNFNIKIVAADNCNPELCYKFTGCADLNSKDGSQQIDTFAIISDNNKTIVNINDCPLDLLKVTLPKIMENYKHIDLLLTGYGGAGAYPQCFDNLSNDEKIKEANNKKNFFLKQALEYLKIVKPYYYLPFAGTYTLTGKLSELQDLRGVPSIDEAHEYLEKHNKISKPIKINPGSSFDLKKGVNSKPYNLINKKEYQDYIINELKNKKLDYELEVVPKNEDLIDLAKGAYKRYLKKLKDLNIKIFTDIFLDLGNQYIKIPCKNSDLEILDKSKFDTNGNYVIYKVDKRMLKWLLLGPKYAHWNNAEIGSHIKFERNPNIFERNIYQSMCYFHN